MKRIKKFFPFLPTDFRAAEEWLNVQAADGLKLEDISVFSFARFTRAESPCHYAARIGPRVARAYHDEFEEFKAFFEPFGWKHKEYAGRLHIFEAEPKHEALESDRGAEAMQITAYLKSTFFGMIGWFSFFASIILICTLWLTPVDWLSRPIYLALLLFTFGTLVMCFIEALAYSRYRRTSKRALDEDAPLPSRAPAAAFLAGAFRYTATLIICIAWIATAIIDYTQNSANPNIIMNIVGAMLGSFIGSVAYKKWGKGKKFVLSAVSVIGTLIVLSICLYFIVPQYGNQDVKELDGLPVLHLIEEEGSQNLYTHYATPLMSQYQFNEYPKSGHDGYYSSFCIDSAIDVLADIAFYDVAYRHSFLGAERDASSFEEYDFSGADCAIISSGGDMLVLRFKKRVVAVKGRYGFELQNKPELIGRIREIFLSE